MERAIFITWRLHGSLPSNRVFPPETTAGEAFEAMDSILDRATGGPFYLSRPEIASMIVDAIRHGQDQMLYYHLHAYVVMANHVHFLITPLVEVARITHSIKRFTARAANRLLGSTGQSFWQDESYDHLVRDQSEFERIVRYVENNPVKAGLVGEPEEFLWSSARGRLKIIENRPAGCNPAPQVASTVSYIQ